MSGEDPDAIRDGTHRYGLRIYFEDTDAGGVVYHANYLRFAERARTEALRALRLPHSEMMIKHGIIFVVRRVALTLVSLRLQTGRAERLPAAWRVALTAMAGAAHAPRPDQ
jgi:acyl-CoA thioesterase FadM